MLEARPCAGCGEEHVDLVGLRPVLTLVRDPEQERHGRVATDDAELPLCGIHGRGERVLELLDLAPVADLGQHDRTRLVAAEHEVAHQVAEREGLAIVGAVLERHRRERVLLDEDIDLHRGGIVTATSVRLSGDEPG